MEKLFEALIDEITTRVLKKLEDNTSDMHNFLNLKVKAENVEGLDDFIDDRIGDKAEEIAQDVVRNTSFSIDVSV